MKTEFRSFEEARKFVRSLSLPSAAHWHLYSSSGKRPKDITFNPNQYNVFSYLEHSHGSDED